MKDKQMNYMNADTEASSGYTDHKPTQLISLLQSLCSRSVCLHLSSAAALIVWDNQCLMLNGARALAQVNTIMAFSKPC